MTAMDSKFAIILLICLRVCYTLPISEDQIHDNGENAEYGEYFQGDMILDYDQMSSILYNNKRNGLMNEKYRWPGNIVFYEIAPEFDEPHVEYIKEGMRKIEEVTCIKFRPRTKTTKDYVYVTGQENGCYSSVGRRGNEQILNLAPFPLDEGCFRLGTIMHELLHALGFYHQQSASDRDNYVRIVEENISENHRHNFIKYSARVVTDFGVEYDYGSVMHYSPYAFSKNGKKTIVPLDEDAIIGQRKGLSPKDIEKINLMYKCPGF